MGKKVKCQHCWKTFEIPDNQANTQRPCVFCQRVTMLQPIESEEKPAVQQTISKSLALQEYAMFGLLALLAFHAILLVVSLTRGESLDKEALAAKQQEQVIALEKISHRLSKCQDVAKKGEDQLSAPGKTVQGLVATMKPSIQLIWDRLAQLQGEIEKLKERVNKAETGKNK